MFAVEKKYSLDQLVFIDIETSGLSPRNDCITQMCKMIAIILCLIVICYKYVVMRRMEERRMEKKRMCDENTRRLNVLEELCEREFIEEERMKYDIVRHFNENRGFGFRRLKNPIHLLNLFTILIYCFKRRTLLRVSVYISNCVTTNFLLHTMTLQGYSETMVLQGHSETMIM